MSFIRELKRRNVFRIGIAYVLMGWVLLQGADFALDLIQAPNWVIQALSIVVVIGLPFALFFAWAFEMTPEGIKKESEVDRTESITHKTGRKLDRMIIVVLVLAVGYLLLDKLVLQDRAAPQSDPDRAAVVDEGGASVAVLPFVNMSNDADNEYFSDGLTETLLHMLAQLPDLRVAARTSSFAFKGQNKSVSEIAATLGVANILEGSVQRAGNQVRVTAQLVRAEDGFHVWSQNYTRPMEDIFAIQDEIAADVADALGASLLGGETELIQGVETTDLTAYDNYLKGLEQQAIFTYGSLDAAEQLFVAALAKDPDFTDARLALARNYLMKRLTGMVNNQEVQQRAQPLLDQVYAQHPGNTQALSYELMLKGRFTDKLRTRDEVKAQIYENIRLLALLPTETFMRTELASGLHFVLEESEAALELLQAGLLVDPMSAYIYETIGEIHQDLDQLDEAEQALLKAMELAPENPTAYGRMSGVERKRNNLPASMEWVRQSIELDPQDHELPYNLAFILFALDLPEEGERWYARVQSMVPGSPMARATEVWRARAKGDIEFAIEASRAMITDQVDVRRGAFFTAIHTYSDQMMKAERSREAYDFLVGLRPEIAEYSTLPQDAQGQTMQEYSLFLMSGFASFEERREAWNTWLAAGQANGFDWLTEGGRRVGVNEIMNGNLDQAVAYYLEHRLNTPVAQNLIRHRKDLPDLFGPLYADPQIATAMAEREREISQVRTDVQEMLLEPEWNQ
jgi:TolB-like protein/cytochrome c-type biogenesis protein CcmH/NrfG